MSDGLSTDPVWGPPQRPRFGNTAQRPQRGQAFGDLRVLGVDDIDTAPPRTYLLKDLLSLAEISLWVGPPKCGKSFLLLHIAYSISLGRSVFKRRVRPARVLYLAAEGEGGFAKRLKVLRDHYGRSEQFHFIAQPADLLHEDGHVDNLIAAAVDLKIQLVVIDTLNRVLAGGDENSAMDMGNFVTNVTRIRYETGAHVAIVHHGTKSSNGSSPRGHGSLTAADDALIEVTKLEDGSREARVIHAKDDAGDLRMPFRLEPVDLGGDEDGDPVTTLRVVETDEVVSAPERTLPLNLNERIALNCLDNAMRASAILATVEEDHKERPVVREADWRAHFYREGKPGEPQETKRKAFKRAVASLLAKGQIATRDDLIWRPKHWG